jgi:hypothetical protein
MFTKQQDALAQATKKFGKTAYTEDTVNYRLVGFAREGKKVFCIGDTWREAMAALEKKVRS